MQFDHKAQLYDHHSHVQEALAQWGAEWLPPAFAKDAHVLELGAGTGTFTRYLTQRVHNLEASDIAHNMLERGKDQFPAISWTLKNAWHLQGGPWDWLCSSSLLQWAPDAASTLTAWQHCLSPKGRVMANFYTAGTLREFNAVSPTPTPLQWRTPASWLAAFSSAGLRPIRHETILKRITYASPIALLRALHHTGAVVPRKTRLPQMRRLLEEYAHRFNADGKVYATWAFTRIEAENSVFQ